MSEQGTPEWFARRCGKFTGSRFAAVMARSKTTGKPLKAYDDLIWQLVVERLTGVQEESFDSYATRWGKDLEEYARQEYELTTGMMAVEVDFIDHPTLPFVGCSPDGLVEAGGLEIKCPKDSRIHLERFIYGMPEEYLPQVQGGMWVTERPWWDFVSYDPRMPESHRLLVIRVNRDDAYIKTLEKAVLDAEKRVQEILADVLRKAA